MTEEQKNTDTGYHVVLQYLPEVKGYAGCRYRTTFSSKADFDSKREEFCRKGRVEVIAEGVTDAESLAKCENVPAINLVAACLEKATGPDGKVNNFILEMEVQKLQSVGLLK